jgi:hypothetical protein
MLDFFVVVLHASLQLNSIETVSAQIIRHACKRECAIVVDEKAIVSIDGWTSAVCDDG